MAKGTPIELELLLNSPEVLQAAEQMKAAIQGVASSAEQAGEKSAEKLAEAYTIGAKKIEVAADKISKAGQNTSAAIPANPQENKQLDEKARLLQSVSDEYRGVLEAGMSTYSQLTPESQRMIIQLNDMDQEMTQVSAAQMNLNKRFDEGRVDVMQYTQAMAGLSVREAELRKGIAETSRSLQGQSQSIANQRPQWNGLGNSINQISRELPAFTYSAQTGFMAIANNLPILSDEINRLKSQNEALTASGKKGVPVWRQVVASLFSWQTALSLGITLMTVYGKEIGEWIQSLFKGGNAAQEAAMKTEAFNKAMDDTNYTGAISQLAELESNINGAKDGLIKKQEVLDQFNETIGKTTGELSTFNELEQWQMDNADNYLQYMFKKAEAQALLQLAVEKTVEAQRKSQNGAGVEDYLLGALQSAGTGSFLNLMNFAEANAMESSTDDKLLSKRYLEMFKDAQNDVQEFAKQNGFDFFGLDEDGGSKTKSTTDARQKLIDQLVAIDAEYARKSFAKDDEELQALQDKFSKIRQLVERFNSDPKNKANAIDLAGLDNSESKAVNDLIFRQETSMIGVELANRKKVFADFEDYKAQVGEEKAREAYAAQLGEYESYMDYLRDLIDENQSTYAAAALGSATGGQQERFALLDQAAKEQDEAERKNNQDIEASYQSHTQKMLIRLQGYLAARAQLEKTRTAEELAELDARFDAETAKLEAAEIKKTESYKQVMQEIRSLTVKQSRELLAIAKQELDAYQGNAEVRMDIEQQIADLQQQINRGSLENIFQIANAIGMLGQSLSRLGDEGSGIAQIGGMLSGLASGVNDLLVAFDENATDLNKVMAGVNGLIGLIDMIGSASRKRKEAERDQYMALIGLQHEYNLSLNEQLRLQAELGESVFLKDFEGRIKSGLTALADANKSYQEAMDKLAGGRAKSGLENGVDWGNVGKGASSGAALGAAVGSIVPVIGTAIGAVIGGIGGALTGLFAGKRKKDTFMPLLEAYPELIQKSEDGVERINRGLAETLIQQGQLDDKTKQLVENVLAYEDAIEQAREQIKGVISELVGQLGPEMRNALVESFRAGEDAALAMGKTVEKVLEDMIAQMIFNRIFADTFKKLEDEMIASTDTESGGDGNWVDDFERFFEASKGLSEAWDQAMKDAQSQAAGAGFDIFNPDNSTQKQGLTGGIERMTESTGTELAGLFRGFFDISKRHHVTSEGILEVERQHYQATLEGLNYWAAIERNTGATVEQLELAVVELKSIVKNTKSGQSLRDMGLGSG